MVSYDAVLCTDQTVRYSVGAVELCYWHEQDLSVLEACILQYCIVTDGSNDSDFKTWQQLIGRLKMQFVSSNGYCEFTHTAYQCLQESLRNRGIGCTICHFNTRTNMLDSSS